MQHNTMDNVNKSRKYAHSLNREQRKRELQQITEENQSILRRIQMKEPTYDHLKWEAEAEENFKFGQMTREYPEGQYE